MLFVLDARTLKLCQAEKGNFQKETLCGKICASSIWTLRQLPGAIDWFKNPGKVIACGERGDNVSKEWVCQLYGNWKLHII